MTIGATPAPIGPLAAPTATSDDKRLQLQTMLLRKSLELQAKEGEAQANSMAGKGSIIDLRV
jgi:hypothetical protein